MKPNAIESEKDVPLVQMNPLNSTVSLKFQKQLSNYDEDDIPVKSLFDFDENKKFIGT